MDLAAFAGLELDLWQQIVLRHMCASSDQSVWNEYTSRHEPLWAAYEYGLVVSRQNGKTALLVARELAGLFLFGERLIVHSAHQFDTSVEAFTLIVSLIENTPELKREVLAIKRSHGEEGIELRNGQRLRFRTRTGNSSGRGFTADCLIFDEASKQLGGQQIGAILPTVQARPNPQMIYAGSAGDRDSEHFGRIRTRALKGDAEWLGFSEWSASVCNPYCPADCENHDDPSEPATWAKANPAMGTRISVEKTAVLYQSMGRDQFLQEILGVGDWPTDEVGWAVIDSESWNRQLNTDTQFTGGISIAVDTSPDMEWTCIAVAGQDDSGNVGVEVTGREGEFDHKKGAAWAVPRIVEIVRGHRIPFVVVDPASPAGTLIPELESHGIKVVTPTTREVAQGCGDFEAGVQPKAGEVAWIVHRGQAPLTTAVAAADRRKLQDLWAWSKAHSAADITPLVAATLAVWGHKKHLYRKKSKPWVMWA